MAKKKVQKRYAATVWGGRVIPGKTYWTTRESNPFKRFWRRCFE